MYIVAITGGIGSGKTTIANQFAALGVDVIDADIIARDMVALGTPTLAAIHRHFGADALLASGELNRRWLREKIFHNPAEKQWLDSKLHPLIREEMLRQCVNAQSPYCLLVVPLLIENQLTHLAHRILVIDVPEETQLQRTHRRDNVTKEHVKAIMATQVSREERLAWADDIIDNQDGDELAREHAILALHNQYLALASQQVAPQ